MERFGKYQYLYGDEPTRKNILEKDSLFWNKGKWDNFILPLC